MSMIAALCLLLFAPLAVFGALTLGPRAWRSRGPLFGIAGAAGSLAGLLGVFSKYWGPETYDFAWLTVSSRAVPFRFGFLVDPLNVLMISVVVIVSLVVQIFSAFYMDRERDQSRYFAFLSFFSFSMTGLVLSPNLLQTFAFWELVGLASYLLIGFWFENPAASGAARKAFVMNRLADLGFLAGIVLAFLGVGTLDIGALSTHSATTTLGPWIALCLFAGVAGKSAQVPFHTWLPDAMEGPTPVSALIHSATMVAAGVFLLVRLFPLFAASHAVLMIILTCGALTALLAASVAILQRDIKRVLAYSTISQLGLMVMSVGSGAPEAAIYHLVTHAFFKALLFLTAGSLIHHFHTNDLFEMARKGARQNPALIGILAFGLLSLAGLPPLGGFFSKDAILHALREHHPYFFFAGLVVSAFTAYYSMRMLFILLFSASPDGPKHRSPVNVSAVLEWFPLLSLAALSVLAGLLGSPLGKERLIRFVWPGRAVGELDPAIIGYSIAVFAIGACLAFCLYRKPGAEPDAQGSPLWRQTLLRKYYFDDAYEFLVKRVALPFASLCKRFDVRVVNGLLVDATSRRVKDLGWIFSRIQSGLLHDYVLIAALVSAAALAYVILGAR